MKYIVVTGGVLSGLGKGVTAASLGRILKDSGYSIVPIKIDGYVNVDPGTMNPYEHGEVYVLDDGAETDLDLGHYERFLSLDLTGDSNITTGSIYKSVIEKERNGDYLGKTVQMIPHITEEIKDRIRLLKADIVLIEVGGTIGDMENMIFIEALRQMSREKGNDFLFIHLSYVPVIVSNEQKSKPTQHSVKELQSMGIQPDIIIGRCKERLNAQTKRKLALFCGVAEDSVLSDPDLEDIYDLPAILKDQGLDTLIIRKLDLQRKASYTFKWANLVDKMHSAKDEVTIGVVGKYTALADAYLSIKEALKHGGISSCCRVNVKWLEADEMTEDDLRAVDGILVPGGFGNRGAEGKIQAITYARENNIPFLGICFGFQLAVVEYARKVCGLPGANTTEADPESPHPVIDLLPEQKEIYKKGGTMRLGAYPCDLAKGSLAHSLYKKDRVFERHRHRWEVNPGYIKALEDAGLRFSGRYPGKDLMEVLELPSHPYFIAAQFHPEFTSRLERPSPLFEGLVKAAMRRN